MAIADFLDDPQQSIPPDPLALSSQPQSVPAPQGLAASVPDAPGPAYGPPEAPSPLYSNLQIGGGLTLPGQAAPAPVIQPRASDVVIPAGSSLGARIQATGAGTQGVLPPSPQTQAPGMFFHKPTAPAAGAPVAAPKAAGGAVAMPPDLVSKDLATQKALTTQAAEDEASGQLGIAGQQANAAQAKEDYAKDMDERAERNASWSRGEVDNIAALNDAAGKFKSDPNRYMKNASFLQKGLLTLAAGLNGAGMGFLKQSGPNQALEQINKNIERDIDDQKSEQEQLRNKGIDATNLYNLNLKALGNEDAARDAAHAHALEALAGHVQAQTSVNQSQSVRDQGALAANQIQTQADQLKQAALARAAASQAAQAKEKNDKIAELAGHLMTSKTAGSDAEALAMAQRAYGQGPQGGAPIAIAGKTAGQQAAHDDALKAVTGTPFTSTNWDPTRNLEGSTADKAVEAEKQRREQMINAVMTSGRPGTQRYASAAKIVDDAYATDKPMPAEKAKARIAAFRKAFGGQVLAPSGNEPAEPEGTP